MSYNDVDILLVEDNLADAELTLDTLKEKNLANKIYHVEDGKQALDFIFAEGQFKDRNIKSKPKLIILDLKLPKINGLEVLKKIKTDERSKAIPVVVLTSSTETKDLVESYELGVNSYVSKPVNFEDFSNSIAELGLYWLILNQQI
jgi:CheY-like chemotaxis protein